MSKDAPPIVSSRSKQMAAIKSKDTSPELFIRRALYKRGFRYRLHYRKLPGKPDLAFPRYRALIEINGCFWHGHNCHIFKWPNTRKAFWRAKIQQNRSRDIKNKRLRSEQGWRTLTIWECAISGKTSLPDEELICLVVKWIELGVSDWQITGDN
ncbi:very short patch repair endonuclease [Microbulbifer agarilyticus]|uniref:very short patch repair endonuclease n=1 Tax=Microbulbifer agarilyticus TaxID=260552 RepID=UPI001CD3D4A9|nr:very short patch repair endonuclease [Microbulbifer agarilyticus]MCA0893289.1 very short patch repair endonuclease [Microbulbifer agarilyticus]